MIRKISSIGTIGLLILSVFVGLDIVPVLNVKATGEPYELWNGNPTDGILGTDGDWVVDSDQVYSSQLGHYKIVVNGDLTISPGFTLELYNVSLEMASTSDGEFGITVQSDPTQGGTLIVSDLDNDPSTTYDASKITSYTSTGNYRFGFIVEGPNGDLQMNNSELHYCGWDFTEAIKYQDSGLCIGTTNITFHDNNVSNCYNGITIYGATNITIDDNEFYQNHQGLFFNSSSNVVVTNNEINDQNTYGAAFENVSGIKFNYNNL
ncbi:MAG: right-handed parallel beta-helix repeat-containing protein, partial [Methanomassiliicoccales archaeon]